MPLQHPNANSSRARRRRLAKHAEEISAVVAAEVFLQRHDRQRRVLALAEILRREPASLCACGIVMLERGFGGIAAKRVEKVARGVDG
jgi:hypothetical protein